MYEMHRDKNHDDRSWRYQGTISERVGRESGEKVKAVKEREAKKQEAKYEIPVYIRRSATCLLKCVYLAFFGLVRSHVLRRERRQHLSLARYPPQNNRAQVYLRPLGAYFYSQLETFIIMNPRRSSTSGRSLLLIINTRGILATSALLST